MGSSTSRYVCEKSKKCRACMGWKVDGYGHSCGACNGLGETFTHECCYCPRKVNGRRGQCNNPECVQKREADMERRRKKEEKREQQRKNLLNFIFSPGDMPYIR